MQVAIKVYCYGSAERLDDSAHTPPVRSRPVRFALYRAGSGVACRVYRGQFPASPRLCDPVTHAMQNDDIAVAQVIFDSSDRYETLCQGDSAMKGLRVLQDDAPRGQRVQHAYREGILCLRGEKRAQSLGRD